MPRKKRASRARVAFLSYEEALELVLGPRGSDAAGRALSVFSSEAARRGLWMAYRDQLLDLCGPEVVPWAVQHIDEGGGAGDDDGNCYDAG